MQITASAFHTGVMGMQAGQRRIDEAAVQLAGATATPQVADQGQLQQAGNLEALTTYLLQLDAGRQQVELAAKAVKTADETMGTLIDTRA
ncbi:hypothetical protein [Stutzerimonas urumqiensis]|uniref:hypothetical protein n=1 Tax=Stutzerimonas urumqiensis TaxID=638269 RepID=UPI000EADE18B|nr:hypothetical protein [Stutzerimonas urumqiensis]